MLIKDFCNLRAINVPFFHTVHVRHRCSAGTRIQHACGETDGYGYGVKEKYGGRVVTAGYGSNAGAVGSDCHELIAEFPMGRP